MRSASRLTPYATRLVMAFTMVLVGCSPVADAGEAPVLDLSVGAEVFGSVGSSSWCRSSFGVDACVAADGLVPEFDAECDADVRLDPRGQGWRLVESNVPIEGSDGGWSIGSAEGDVLVDMDAPSVDASWYFIIERPGC